MKLNNTFKSRLYVTLSALILLGGVGQLGAWSSPKGTPPNFNTLPPIHEGATNQVKEGAFGVNWMAVRGDAVLLGNVKAPKGTPGPNMVLTAIDSEGNAEWRALPAR